MGQLKERDGTPGRRRGGGKSSKAQMVTSGRSLREIVRPGVGEPRSEDRKRVARSGGGKGREKTSGAHQGKNWVGKEQVFVRIRGRGVERTLGRREGDPVREGDGTRNIKQTNSSRTEKFSARHSSKQRRKRANSREEAGRSRTRVRIS